MNLLSSVSCASFCREGRKGPAKCCDGLPSLLRCNATVQAYRQRLRRPRSCCKACVLARAVLLM